MKYPTSDGHEFAREKDAREWQSAIDYNTYLKSLEQPYGLGQYRLELKSVTEAIILRKYLVYYLGFDVKQAEKIPIRMDEDSLVLIDRIEKVVEVL